jgi:hypothetical protein
MCAVKIQSFYSLIRLEKARLPCARESRGLLRSVRIRRRVRISHVSMDAFARTGSPTGRRSR